MSYERKKHDSFIIHDDQAGLILSLPMTERGELITALVQHHLGIEPEGLAEMTKACYKIISNQMDREEESWNEKCEKQRQKGLKSALAKQQNNQKSTVVKPEQNRGLTYKDNDKDTDNDTDKENEKEKEISKEKINKKENRFAKPTLTDVEQYTFETGLNINAQQFYDYYEGNGWKVGMNPMKDWRATARNWARRSQTKDRVNIIDTFY